MADEQILNIQKVSEYRFVLLFLYNKNIKIKRAIIAIDVATYGNDTSVVII
jgi:hypothetical protein